LFFNGAEFCSSVSEYRNKLTNPHHLVELQEVVERGLDYRTDHQ